MVGRTEGAGADERRLRRQHPGHAVDLGHFQRLVDAEARQDARQRLGDERLARARRAGHQRVVPAGGADFHRPLDVLLAHDVGEVGGVDRLGLEGGLYIDFNRRERFHFGQMADELGQIAHRVNVDVGHQRRLGGILGGHEHALDPFIAGHGRQRQHALGVAGRAVQRKLAEEERAVEQVVPHLRRGGQHADGDGQVIGRAFLAQIGRGQVDGDAMEREGEAAVLDGGVDPVAALAHGGVGQAHQGEVRCPIDDVHFDVDEFGVQADDGGAEGFGEHEGDYSTRREEGRIERG